jgi:hypothetical protein
MYIGGYMGQEQDQNYMAFNYYDPNYQAPGAAGGLNYDNSMAYSGWQSVVQPTMDYGQAQAYDSGVKQKSGALFKTQLCRHFEQKGFCNLGDSCNFAHGKEELKDAPPGTQPVPSYNYGFQAKSYQQPQQQQQLQQFGNSDHSNSKYYKTVECRNFEQTGQCQYGVNCKFAHGEAELRPTPAGPMPRANSYQSYTSPPAFPGYQMPPNAGYYPYDMGYQQAYPTEQQQQQQPAPVYDMGISAPVDPSQNYNYTYSADQNYYPGYIQPVAPENQEETPNIQYYAPPMPGTGFKQDGFQQ